MTLDARTYVATVEREGRRALDIARSHPDAPVPGCPDWTVADLAAHLGRVYRSVALHLHERATEMIPGDRVPRAPEDATAVADFLAEGLDIVVAALGDVDPTEAVWSWSGDHSAGFYLRRMANETAVHRWDAESAVGSPEPLDPELAADGVDELLTVVLPFAVARWERPDPGGTIHLHRTDGDGEWLASLVQGQLEVRHEHAKGDVAVRAAASDLVLALWERSALDGPEFEVFGDLEVARAWMALSR